MINQAALSTRLKSRRPKQQTDGEPTLSKGGVVNERDNVREHVRLPRLNHDVTSDGIRVCKGLLCGQDGHGTGLSLIPVSLP